MTFRLSVFLFVGLVIATASEAVASIIHVPGDTTIIQVGIDMAVDGDTVLVADGIYVENINFHGKAIVVASHLIVDDDSSHIAKTVIDGSQPRHPDSGSVVFFISGEDTTSILSGFTITGGTGTTIPTQVMELDRGGGGIFCWNSGACIENNLIAGNVIDSLQTAGGGGIFSLSKSDSFSIKVVHNTITTNFVDVDSLAIGGGVFLVTKGMVVGNVITENELLSRGGCYGGGIFGGSFSVNWGPLELSGNTVAHNQCHSTGRFASSGAVYINYFGDVSVLENTISHNHVSNANLCWGAGLALLVFDGEALVQDNVISHNSFQGGECRGGGLLSISNPSLRIHGNRIEQNAATFGGGIATWYSSPLVQRNVIARNSASSGAGLWINKFPFDGHLKDEKLLEIIEPLPFSPGRKEALIREIRRSSLQNSDPHIINNTIVDNHASEAGAGIHMSYGVARISNSIIWGNTAPHGSQLGGGHIVKYSDVQGGYYGIGNRDLDPAFSDTVNYYLTPSVSPCIDAGDPDSAHNDLEDPHNPGFPLWPALGGLRNDMGAHGGNPFVRPADELILGPLFSAFIERVDSASSSERQAIVDSFMAEVPSFPFVEDPHVVYFIYRGAASRVTVPGDANGWSVNTSPMTRLADTDLWYWQDIFESNARLDYKFVLNGSNWILDPLNPRQVWGGFGPNSELVMPDFVEPPEIEYYPYIPHGTLHDTTVFSANLNNLRTVRVYTPPSYNSTTTDSFPLVLLHDGQEYLSLASANNVLDYLIAEDLIQPLIAVFVPPVNREEEYAFSQRELYSSFIIDELMPVIDARYRTKRDPASRAMIGISFGGHITTKICYEHPESFGLCGPFSPAYWPNNGAVYTTVIHGPRRNLVFYLDWGTYEIDIMFDARELRDILVDKGYQVEWNEWHEGHSWGSWRAHLDDALEFFFPGSSHILHEDEAKPTEFGLMQNYPNPFNEVTEITYVIGRNSRVRLEIFNVLGQRVATLVDETQRAGLKTVQWNAGSLSSGVYLYRLQAGGHSETKRMVLLR